eukprot:GHVU01069697.1.p1 GENE.GHVU01069697.1~~GHVU01069697.1.p1  ORF type:complete len:113 (-),score=6.49 GHVU01069697.1:403-741(-)
MVDRQDQSIIHPPSPSPFCRPRRPGQLQQRWASAASVSGLLVSRPVCSAPPPIDLSVCPSFANTQQTVAGDVPPLCLNRGLTKIVVDICMPSVCRMSLARPDEMQHAAAPTR